MPGVTHMNTRKPYQQAPEVPLLSCVTGSMRVKDKRDPVRNGRPCHQLRGSPHPEVLPLVSFCLSPLISSLAPLSWAGVRLTPLPKSHGSPDPAAWVPAGPAGHPGRGDRHGGVGSGGSSRGSDGGVAQLTTSVYGASFLGSSSLDEAASAELGPVGDVSTKLSSTTRKRSSSPVSMYRSCAPSSVSYSHTHTCSASSLGRAQGQGNNQGAGEPCGWGFLPRRPPPGNPIPSRACCVCKVTEAGPAQVQEARPGRASPGPTGSSRRTAAQGPRLGPRAAGTTQHSRKEAPEQSPAGLSMWNDPSPLGPTRPLSSATHQGPGPSSRGLGSPW